MGDDWRSALRALVVPMPRTHRQEGPGRTALRLVRKAKRKSAKRARY